MQRAVIESRERDASAWAAFAGADRLAMYTDGSAPIRNPGGVAGFGLIIVGYAGKRLAARVDVGGFIAARGRMPATSNNRAEIAGLLAALFSLRFIAPGPWSRREVIIRSDSQYAIRCAQREWAQNANQDVWSVFDRVAAKAAAVCAGAIGLEWVRGHAGDEFNSAADHMATAAAFNFDSPAYERYRAAQQASGREMPGAAAVARTESAPVAAQPPLAMAAPKVTAGQPMPKLARSHALARTNEPASTPTSRPMPIPPAPTPAVQATPVLPIAQTSPAGAPPTSAAHDYAIIVRGHLDGHGHAGRSSATGSYLVATRTGRADVTSLSLPGPHTGIEANYVTLAAALRDLLARVEARGKDPHAYSVLAQSHDETMVNQLTGAYRIRVPELEPLSAATCARCWLALPPQRSSGGPPGRSSPRWPWHQTRRSADRPESRDTTGERASRSAVGADWVRDAMPRDGPCSKPRRFSDAPSPSCRKPSCLHTSLRAMIRSSDNTRTGRRANPWIRPAWTRPRRPSHSTTPR